MPRSSPRIESKRAIFLSHQNLLKLTKRWVDYYLRNRHKLFRHGEGCKSSQECLDLISRSRGFLITAFAGKAQNNYTHPSRLPDLGELNLLSKIRAIQLLTHRPTIIVLDSEYYSEAFYEDPVYIRSYDQAIKNLGRMVGLNKEFRNSKSVVSVRDLLRSLKVPQTEVRQRVNRLRQYPDRAYRKIEIYPKELYETVARVLPEGLKIENFGPLEENNTLSKVCSDFIILKAVLADIIQIFQKKKGFQRITILKYSHTQNPRINTEMNIAPWNSTILFKRNFLNINTAINANYSTLNSDPRNYIIVGENNYFWGFSRNRQIFKSL